MEKTIYRSTTGRYLLAVLIIAVLSTSAYYTLQSALSDSDATAYIVNLSGKQRMLSQHIALDAHRYNNARQANSFISDQHLSQMRKNITDMRQANMQLSSGVLLNDLKVEVSNSIHEMYFGNMKLYERVNNYLDIAQKLQNSSSNIVRLSLLNSIDEQSEQLLIDLNKAVQQYQIEGENRLSRIEDLEVIVWIATLIALILEVIFIFKPMTNRLVASQKAQARTLENLEEIIEQRTQKLEIANKKLKELATRDPLTKLKNRLTLESDVEKIVKKSEQHQIPFALGVIDVDFFKSVNDTLGHTAGDYVLKELAGLMTNVTREYDHLYRAGGEEFVLLLNRTHLHEANTIFEKIRTLIEAHKFEYEGNTISITISVGVYHSSLQEITRVQDIIIAADQALYRAKKAGRNCISIVPQDS
jgi:diguanylate cyclase (GGDEF)-like protein